MMSSLNILSIEIATKFLAHSDELITIASKTDPNLFSKTDIANFTDDLKKLKAQAEEVVGLTDDVKKLNRIRAFNKWINKIHQSFDSHILGELGVEKISFKSGMLEDEFVTLGHGGHKWNPDIRLQKNKTKIPDSPLNDQPFRADIEIRYKYEWLPKKQTSSVFPENWDLQRIKEEVAWVYENTVVKGIIPFDDTGKFVKYLYKDSSGNFDILIEVNENGKIMNSYPYLK